MSGLRPFRAGFWFGGFNGLTWMVGLGTPMVLLAQRLGADAFEVGLASSFVFLLMPVVVLSTSSLRRLGYRRQMMLGWSSRAAFLLVPLGLAWSAPADPAPWMPAALVASVFGFCAFRAFGVAAHVPWFAAILPDHLRGRFFATDHAITSVVGVATLLSTAFLFDRLPDYEAFRIAYGVALSGSLLAVWNLSRLPAGPTPSPAPLAALSVELRRLFLRAGVFRHYLALSLSGAVVTSSLVPFSVYYLKVEAGLAASHVLAFTAAQFGGQILGSVSIRRLLDRVPVRRFFQLSSAGIAAVHLFWLTFVTGTSALEPLLGGAYALFGVAVGISNATHFTYLPELSEEARRPVTLATFTAVWGVLSGLAPMAWGWLLRAPGPEPGVDAAAFALFFALGLAVSLALIPLYSRLPDPRAALAASAGAAAPTRRSPP